MLTTRFTQLIGCSVPIQQAPIGGLANADLAAAVSNAGALEMKTVSGQGRAPDRVLLFRKYGDSAQQRGPPEDKGRPLLLLCPRRGSNPHGRTCHASPLRARLPVSPLGP